MQKHTCIRFIGLSIICFLTESKYSLFSTPSARKACTSASNSESPASYVEEEWLKQNVGQKVLNSELQTYLNHFNNTIIQNNKCSIANNHSLNDLHQHFLTFAVLLKNLQLTSVYKLVLENLMDTFPTNSGRYEALAFMLHSFHLDRWQYRWMVFKMQSDTV